MTSERIEFMLAYYYIQKYEEIKKAIEENKEFIDSKDEILKELSELRKAENESVHQQTKTLFARYRVWL